MAFLAASSHGTIIYRALTPLTALLYACPASARPLGPGAVSMAPALWAVWFGCPSSISVALLQ